MLYLLLTCCFFRGDIACDWTALLHPKQLWLGYFAGDLVTKL